MPIFAIPAYVDFKPMLKSTKTKSTSLSFLTHEEIANSYEALIAHPLSKTENILKTELLSSTKDYDVVSAVAYGHATQPRIDLILMRGGDRRMHLVPVPWTEFIPVQQSKNFMLLKNQAEGNEENVLENQFINFKNLIHDSTSNYVFRNVLTIGLMDSILAQTSIHLSEEVIVEETNEEQELNEVGEIQQENDILSSDFDEDDE